MKTARLLVAGATLIALGAAAPAAEPDVAHLRQALADYVGKPDSSFRWVKRQEGRLGLGRYVELRLTSQTWHGVAWKHQLFILKPSTAPAGTRHALLFITGGSWRKELDDPDIQTRVPREARMLALLAEQLKTPVAVLLQVPHQPLFEGRYEDAIIALTFQRFLETGDPQWPLLLPMVKSAVRGIDAVAQFASQEWSMDIKTYTVTGASKRGWTTWLTGAVDRRATALAPMVIDMLNMKPQMEHQKAVWGKLSYKISDYSERGLTEKLSTDEGQALQTIVDPWRYRQELTQPKLIIIGTNDHYWPLDALNLYWNDLPGPKYILYVPNNRHGLQDYERVLGSLNALHQHAANGFRLPRLSWSFERAGGTLRLRLSSDVRPQKVQAWTATSASRDFRQSTWQAEPIQRHAEAHRYELELPASGYAALFGEVVFEDLGLPYYLSTNVRVVGNRDPAQPAP